MRAPLDGAAPKVVSIDDGAQHLDLTIAPRNEIGNPRPAPYRQSGQAPAACPLGASRRIMSPLRALARLVAALRDCPPSAPARLAAEAPTRPACWHGVEPIRPAAAFIP